MQNLIESISLLGNDCGKKFANTTYDMKCILKSLKLVPYIPHKCSDFVKKYQSFKKGTITVSKNNCVQQTFGLPKLEHHSEARTESEVILVFYADTGHPANAQENHKKLERGWISFSARKTHRAHVAALRVFRLQAGYLINQ